MSDYLNDSLDDMLNQAFAREYATLVDAEFVDRAMQRVRLQSRIRLLVLGIALTIGAIVCASYALPVIANIGAWLGPLTTLPSETLLALPKETLLALPRETLLGALTIGLLIVIAPCLFILVDDPI